MALAAVMVVVARLGGREMATTPAKDGASWGIMEEKHAQG